MNNDDMTMTVDDLQDLVRDGKVRVRSFGDERTFGYDRNFNGDLNAAADALPKLLASGLMVPYFDERGIFLGPANPHYVANDFDRSDDGRVLQ